MDINILFPELENFLCCQECHSRITFSETRTRGLGCKINMTCSNCKEWTDVHSSKLLNNRTTSTYAVNRNSVFAACTLGHGYSGLAGFCDIMELPKILGARYFASINGEFKRKREDPMEESISQVVKEKVYEPHANDDIELDVPVHVIVRRTKVSM